MKTSTIKPFANESDALSVGELNIENREDRVSIYGGLDITKDQQGLKHALMLLDVLSQIVEVLKGADLPEKLPSAESITRVKNPFTKGE